MLRKSGWAFFALLIIFSVASIHGYPFVSVVQGSQNSLEKISDPGNKVLKFTIPPENKKIFETPPRRYHYKGDYLVKATKKDCRECHLSQYYPQQDFFGWESSSKWKLHWALFSLAAFVMFVGLYATVSIWLMGRRPSLHHPMHWPSATSALFREGILGERVWGHNRLRWAIFILISVAFMALAVVFVLTLITRFLLPPDNFIAVPGGLILDFLADLLGGCILAGVLLALYRRYIKKDDNLKSDPEDLIILLLLLGIIVTGFFLESCRLAVVSPEPQIWASFLGAMGASILGIWDAPWTVVRFYIWIVHAVLVFVFFAYLPFSKLFHLMTSPISIAATASEAHYRQRL